MKNVFSLSEKSIVNPYSITPLAFVLVSCMPNRDVLLTKQPVKIENTLSQNKKVLPPFKEPEQTLHGTITSVPDSRDTHKIIFNLSYDRPREFRTQAVDCKAFSHLEVYISGINISTNLYPAAAVNGKIPVVSGAGTSPCDLSTSISNVPSGKARIATVKAYKSAGTVLIPGTTIKSAFDITTSNVNVEMSYKTTPTGLTIEDLIDDPNPLLASQINLTDLQNFVNNVTGASGSYPNFTYSTHPSLVKADVIKTDLVNANGNVNNLNSADTKYKMTADTLSVDVTNVVATDVITSQLTDPGSLAKTSTAGASSFSESLTGIFPGNWDLIVTQVPSAAFSSHNTLLITNINSTTTANQTANMGNAPSINTIAPFSTANSALGSTAGFLINGANFLGTTNVNFNGVDATVTNITTGILTVTTPAGLTSGPVFVTTPGGNTKSGTDLMALEASTNVSTAANSQKHSALAYNSTANEYLVVWEDYRTNSDADVYARRINAANGSYIGNEIAIKTGPNDQEMPDVAYNPTSNEYLVTWNGFVGAAHNIYGRRVNASTGALLGCEIQISTQTATNDLHSAVAHNSTNNEYMVLWEDERNSNPNSDIYARRINGGTDAPIGCEISIAATTLAQKYPDIAYNATNNEYMVVWDDNASGNVDAFGARLSSTGTNLGGITVSSTTNNQKQPKVAWNSTNNEFLVAFDDDRTTAGTDDIYGQRINGAGALQGGNIIISAASANQRSANLTYNSVKNEYLVTWNDTRTVNQGYAQRIKANDGSIIGSDNDANFLFAQCLSTLMGTRPAVGFSPTSNSYLFSFHDLLSDNLQTRKMDGVD